VPFSWDNATRGLDANTALTYAKTMRTLTDVSGNTTVVSLYQAGNQIYNLFDKVTVIAEGLIIYYGPRSKAKDYFEDLGFICVDGANIADFLTGVTVKRERKIKEGMEHEVGSSSL
jgi:ATP-binding cassette subfamily G (WHITE) protein 2 (SNQ2)